MLRGNARYYDFLATVKSLGETFLGWAVGGGLVVIFASLVYILGGVFTGQLFTVAKADLPRVTQSVDSMSAALLYAAVAVAFIGVIRTKEQKAEIGGAVALGGLFCWFGFPALCAYCIQAKAPAAHMNEAVLAAYKNFALAGKGMLCALAWPFVQAVWRGVRAVPLRQLQDDAVAKFGLRREAPKEAKPLTKPHALSPCWHLPYCRDYLVQLCPAFKARKRCWKFGGGCFCDSNMLEAMLTGMSRGPKRSDQAYLRSEVDARRSVLSKRQQKTPCKSCFIYLEHEKLKYQVMNPLAYPLTAALVYFGYEPYIKPAWLWAQVQLSNVWGALAFQHVNNTVESLQQIAGMEIATVMFAVLLGMWLLLWMLRLCEVWCFKWKL